MWHIDYNEKLIAWGFHIHGAVDRHSRFIILFIFLAFILLLICHDTELKMLTQAKVAISATKLHIIDELVVITRSANVRQSTDMSKQVTNYKTQKDCCTLFVLCPTTKVIKWFSFYWLFASVPSILHCSATVQKLLQRSFHLTILLGSCPLLMSKITLVFNICKANFQNTW